MIKFNFYTQAYSDKEIVNYTNLMFEENIHNDKFIGYIGAEFIDLDNGIYRYITDEEGKRPFAIRTLNAPDNSLSKNVISVIPIKDNYNLVSIIKDDKEVIVNVRKVHVNNDNITIGENTQYVNHNGLMSEFDNVTLFKSVFTGIKKLEINEPNTIYTMDKYSYNPMLRVTTRLFININDSLCTMRTDSGILEISNNTPDKWETEGVPYKSGIYRVYYYTNHDNKYKYVRGVRLDLVTEDNFDKDDVIYQSMRDNLCVFTTIYGDKIIGSVIGTKYILLYKMNGSIHSLKLHQNEYKLIDSYNKI